MVKQVALFLCAISLCLYNSVNCAKLPQGTKKCKITDSICIKDSAQKFIPLLAHPIAELGTESFEPLYIGNIRNDGLLNFNFTDAIISGTTKTTIINELTFDPKKRRITLIYTNTGHMDSNYKANGRLIILPVTGDGKAFFKIFDIQYIYKFAYDVVKAKDGKEYIKILKHKVTYTPKDVDFRFTNLFNGNKQLSDAIHTFGNENWREIFGEMGKPFMTKITTAVADNISKIMSRVSVDELFVV